MAIQVKRVYEAPAPEDGLRVLVDRLWPRGLSKEKAAVDHWAREIAPSDDLRRWYGHDPARWAAFRKRYFAELDANAEAVADLAGRLRGRRATLLFGSKEERLNNAAALQAYLASRL